jgi:beta-aspartyl-peptidase (threonine type)
MLILVHGGAGFRKPSRKHLQKLHQSLTSGYTILKAGGTSLDAVTVAIRILEDSGLFNAGLGGNLQMDGVRRLDASLMEGTNLKAGSVIGLEGIRNPIQTARFVMDSPHVMLTNAGARKIAEANGLPCLPEPDEKSQKKLQRFVHRNRKMLELYTRYFSTVGAVALDADGVCAAGASTGGIMPMLPGRVGDTPIIGSGIYADNSSGAVSCTGYGEYILRLALAKEICMNLQGHSPYAASAKSFRKLIRIGGSAGVIVVNRRGQFSIIQTTAYMASGYADRKGIAVSTGSVPFSR